MVHPPSLSQLNSDMKILIVEDNDIKFNILRSWFEERFAGSDIQRASSYQSGVRSILKNEYDWVILDMTLPPADELSEVLNREPLTFGGELVLREVSRRKVKPRIIVVSQYKTFLRNEEAVSFEKLREELLSDYEELVVDCVRLEADRVDWKVAIEKIICNK